MENASLLESHVVVSFREKAAFGDFTKSAVISRTSLFFPFTFFLYLRFQRDFFFFPFH